MGIISRIKKLYRNISETRQLCEQINEKLNDQERRLQHIHGDIKDEMHGHLNTIEGALFNYYMPQIMSYIENEVRIKQGEIENSSTYRYFCKIHELLGVHEAKDVVLERKGRNNDGGYVMANPYSETKIAYSIGICDDVSWDLDMAKIGYEVYQYDHTINSLPEENDAFHWKKIGLTGETETEELKHLETVIEENGHLDKKGMLLKMDIEGYEWGVLSQIDKTLLNKFDQIILELHGLNTNDSYEQEIILKALEKLTANHGVISVHANNNDISAFCGDKVIANMIEVCLLSRDKYDLKKTSITIPNTLDQPCNPNLRELYLGRW